MTEPIETAPALELTLQAMANLRSREIPRASDEKRLQWYPIGMLYLS
jgi:hypothetical protein